MSNIVECHHISYKHGTVAKPLHRVTFANVRRAEVSPVPDGNSSWHSGCNVWTVGSREPVLVWESLDEVTQQMKDTLK